MNFCFHPTQLRFLAAAFLAILAHLALFLTANLPQNKLIYSDINQVLNHSLKLNIAQIKLVENSSESRPQNKHTNIDNINSANNYVRSNINEKSDLIPIVTEAKLHGTKIPPQYPARALKLGQEGQVIIQVLLDENGLQLEQEIINSSGYILLDNSAIKAVKKWSFLPYEIEGKRSKSYIQIPVEFKIS